MEILIIAGVAIFGWFIVFVSSRGGTKSHNINAGYLSGRYQAASYRAHTEAIEEKIKAKAALVNLEVDDYAYDIAKINREILLKDAQFARETAHLHLQWKHEQQISTYQHQVAVLQGAREKKMDLPTYNLVMAEVEKERGLSGVRIDEHRQLKAIDNDADLTQQLNTIRAILEFKHIDFNRFDEVRNRILSLIDEEGRIDTSNASALVKGQKLELIEKAKRVYGEILNAYSNRLLEAGDGDDLSGIESLFTNEGRLGVGAKAIPQDALSAITVRSRREPSNH